MRDRLSQRRIQRHLLLFGFFQDVSRRKLSIHTPLLSGLTLLKFIQKHLLPL